MGIKSFQSFSIGKKIHGFLTAMIVVPILFCCNNAKEPNPDKKGATDPKIANLKRPSDFHDEHLYSPGENEQGSWVAMTFDDKGRMITCDQFENLYRVTIPPIGADTVKSKIKVEKLEIKIAGDTAALKIGFAHGLLYRVNSHYVMVNDEGSKSLEGQGEHGPHSVVLAPDKKLMKSLYKVL
jgi:uncharacterized lipoprotein NlpE involved in copper resistance